MRRRASKYLLAFGSLKLCPLDTCQEDRLVIREDWRASANGHERSWTLYPSNVKEEGLWWMHLSRFVSISKGRKRVLVDQQEGRVVHHYYTETSHSCRSSFCQSPHPKSLHVCYTSSLKNRCKITFHLVFANLLCLNIAAFKNSAPHYLHDDRLLSRFFSCISPPSFLTIVLLIWCAHLSSRSRWKKSLPTLTLFYFYFIYPLVVRKVDWLLPSNVVWTGRVMRGSHSSSSSIVPVARAHFARTPPL